MPHPQPAMGPPTSMFPNPSGTLLVPPPGVLTGLSSASYDDLVMRAARNLLPA